MPLAGTLAGELSCKVAPGQAVAQCTGAVTGTFGGLPVQFNAAILQPNLWQGLPALSLQAALTLGPVGKVNLVVVLPAEPTVGVSSYGQPLPLATLHRMGTGAAQAPHLGVGTGGYVEVLAVAPATGGQTDVKFDFEFATFASQKALCQAAATACVQAELATCDVCGTGYAAPAACPAGKTCQAGACAP